MEMLALGCVTAACVRAWLLHAGGLCVGDLRGDVLPSIWSWKNTPLARKGTSLQADKYSRVAPSGVPDTGSSGLAFFFLHSDRFQIFCRQEEDKCTS